MNCKPGDLAVIVGGFPECNIGKIIRVTKRDAATEFLTGIPAWKYEGAYLVGMNGGRATSVCDSCLRPIRDPGDDVPDESTAWVPPLPVCDPVQVEPTFIRLPVREMP